MAAARAADGMCVILGVKGPSDAFAGRLEVYAGRQGRAGFRNGPRNQALFSAPRGLCADTNGTLVIADSNNSCVRRIDVNGEHCFPTMSLLLSPLADVVALERSHRRAAVQQA